MAISSRDRAGRRLAVLLWVSSAAALSVALGEDDAPRAARPGSGAASATAADRERAVAAFERFKGLAGRWKGRSTKGWTDESDVRVIAAGSVVEIASFDAHPGEQMRTLVHLDGDRLILTHYCVARNQPRLVAKGFDPDGAGLTFTFLDATNLPSRDKGHMDKAVYRFLGPDRYTSRWTWYQEGQERWMEEIESVRVP